MRALEVLERQRAQIEDLCRRYGVRRLRLFGSATRHDWNPETSDFDFVVEFDYSGAMRPSDRYFGLKEALEQTLSKPVDLVCYPAIRNRYFKEEVDETQVELYAA